MRFWGIVFILFSFCHDSFSQYKWEFGLSTGISNYLGEIGGTSKKGMGTAAKPFINDLRLANTKFAEGIHIRYKIHPVISLKMNMMYIRIGGADSLSDYAPRNARNLHFRNDIIEGSLNFEYHFLEKLDINQRGRLRVDFGAYGFFGGGIFYHNPKGYYKNEWIDLRPLSTEGLGIIEGRPNYSQVQICWPTGAGFYFTLNRKFRLGWEFGFRKTYTDYLDDISNRYISDETFYSNLDPETAEVAIYMANQNPQAEQRFIKNGQIEDMPDNRNYGGNSIRGNPNDMDSYLFSVFTFSYIAKGKGSFYRTANTKNNKHRRKRRKRRSRAKF